MTARSVTAPTKALKVLTLNQAIQSLRYIAESPAQEYGGFYPQTVLCVKSALHHINRQQRKIKKLSQGVL